jgi:hypothetical protein
MTPQAAKEEIVSEIYELLRLAAARRQPMAAIYDGQSRLLCPHVGGRKSGRLHVFFYQFGGSSNSELPITPDGVGGWRCLAVEKLSQVELSSGAWHTEPAPLTKPASMKSISTLTLSLETTRKKDTEAVAVVTGAPE